MLFDILRILNLLCFASVIPESSEGAIGGLGGGIGILIIIIIGLLYSSKSGTLLYTGWCNLISCLLTSEMTSQSVTLTNAD